MKHGKQLVIVTAALASAAFQAPLFARTCAGNGEVIGSFGLFAQRSGYFLIGATPPGTTAAGAPILVPVGVTPPGSTGALTTSNTTWGKFVGSLAGNGVFSGGARIYADGLGNLYASSTTGGSISNSPAGTYTLSTDCSITMSLKDPFFTPPSAEPGIIVPTGASVTLEGEFIDSGHIEAVVTGPNSAGATVTLLKTSQFNGCTTGNLAGSFVVVGSGLALAANGAPTSTPGTPVATPATPVNGAFTSGVTGTLGTPFTVLGRFVADGIGNFLPESLNSQSPLTRTLTGTYKVNVDCTGSGKIVDAAGVTRNIDFVLVNPASQSLSPTTTNIRQQVQFVFSDTGVVGQGIAVQQ